MLLCNYPLKYEWKISLMWERSRQNSVVANDKRRSLFTRLSADKRNDYLKAKHLHDELFVEVHKNETFLHCLSVFHDQIWK